MVADMSYSTVSNVIGSWEQVRRTENYQEVVGTQLLIKFFDQEPNAKVIFGFKVSEPNESLIKSRRFIQHAGYFIKMIDKALDMLGPDIELLTEILLELGRKHVSYGVRPEHFPSMGRALIDSVSDCLGDGFTSDVKDSWVEVYGALSYDMIRAQKVQHGCQRLTSSDSVTVGPSIPVETKKELS